VSSARRFTTRHMNAALELYSRGLSCRAVAAALAGMFDPAPSHAWVSDIVSRRFAQTICWKLRHERDAELRDESKHTGRSGRTSRGLIRRLWFADTPDAKARRERLDRVVSLRLAGWGYREIAAETGVPMGSISHYLKRAGLRRERQFRNPRTKSEGVRA